jgi:hypothetical protein
LGARRLHDPDIFLRLATALPLFSFLRHYVCTAIVFDRFETPRRGSWYRRPLPEYRGRFAHKAYPFQFWLAARPVLRSHFPFSSIEVSGNQGEVHGEDHIGGG